MNSFIQNPINERSFSARKLVFGVGINDASYIITNTIKGKTKTCPFYQKWNSMLARVFSPLLHKKQPYYIGTTVSAEWLIFSNFRLWMEKQEWEGKELDKDILNPGNRHYSKDTCIFISKTLNNLFSSNGASNRVCPTGVHFDRQTSKYRTTIRTFGKEKHLGRFNTREEARLVYIKAKIAYIETFFCELDDKGIQGLKKHIDILYQSTSLS